MPTTVGYARIIPLSQTHADPFSFALRIFHDAQGVADVNCLVSFLKAPKLRSICCHDSEAKEHAYAKDSEAKEQKSRGSMLLTISFCPIRYL